MTSGASRTRCSGEIDPDTFQLVRLRGHVALLSREGRPSDSIAVPRVERDGRAYAEVRIPEGFAVAIIRKGR